MKKDGFTLVEILIAAAVLSISVLALSGLYVSRKHSEYEVKAYAQLQSIEQFVISNYYSRPKDFPIMRANGGGGQAGFYRACLSSDGRTIEDYHAMALPDGRVPGAPTYPLRQPPCTPEFFEVQMIPNLNVNAAFFSVQIFPMGLEAVQDRRNTNSAQLHVVRFNLPYDQGISTSFAR